MPGLSIHANRTADQDVYPFQRRTDRGNLHVIRLALLALIHPVTSRSIPFRNAYLQPLIDMIEVGDNQIRIKGSKEVLERAILASRNGVAPGSEMSTKWRAKKNKNENSLRWTVKLLNSIK